MASDYVPQHGDLTRGGGEGPQADEELERFYDRITSCSVVIEAPIGAIAKEISITFAWI